MTVVGGEVTRQRDPSAFAWYVVVLVGETTKERVRGLLISVSPVLSVPGTTAPF